MDTNYSPRPSWHQGCGSESSCDPLNRYASGVISDPFHLNLLFSCNQASVRLPVLDGLGEVGGVRILVAFDQAGIGNRKMGIAKRPFDDEGRTQSHEPTKRKLFQNLRPLI